MLGSVATFAGAYLLGVVVVNGMWGVLAIGIFAVGNPDTAAWNGVESAVTGIYVNDGVAVPGGMSEEPATVKGGVTAPAS